MAVMVLTPDLVPACLFGGLIALEVARGGRQRASGVAIALRGRRWLGNGGLFVANALLGLMIVQQADPGQPPAGWLAWGLGLLFLDLVHYVGHRLMHRVPLLWRVHVVHHNDLDLDVTTSLRTHPFEFLVGYGLALAMALLAGLPASIIAGYGALVMAVEMLQHARLTMPETVERSVRLLFVTPGYHRLHHSPERAVHDSNYGAVFTLWDRLFGTMRLPQVPGEPARVGVPGHDSARWQSLTGLLAAPFL